MIKQKRYINKKAIFFSLDALIALIIILLSITVIYPIIKYSEKESRVPEDILVSLSALKIGEMNSDYVNGPGGLIAQGKITDLDKSVLEQIGEFYVSTDPATKLLANELAADVLSTIDANENIGIWYNQKLLASQNKTSYESAKNVNVERQTISGIQEGNAITGYSARAFLTNSEQTKYYYFGGYVGEGNITLNIEYSGQLTNISLEIAANKDFKICIRDYECEGFFEHVAPSELEPESFPLYSYRGKFNPGEVNTFKLVPADGSNNLHVAGGYLKLTYEDGVQYEQAERYYFPGIEGFVNLYDGFYVPGILNNLKINVTAKVDDPAKKMYMKFGDIVIFNETTNGGEVNIIRDNSYISAKFTEAGKTYPDFSEKTIPIRIGIVGVDYEQSEMKAHIIPVNSLSGAMNSIKGNVDGVEGYEQGLPVLKYVTNNLVDEVINSYDFSYVGLSTTKSASFSSSSSVFPTTRDKTNLHTVINNWNGNGNLDVCPALQKAIDEFKTKPIDDAKFMVNLIYKMPNSCNDKTDPLEIKQEIINILCQASKDYKIQIYNVEVGLSGSTNGDRVAEAMQYTSSSDTCYGGKYYDGDTYLGGDLVKIYDEIVEYILSLIFDMQSIDIINSANAGSYLSPDSYIEFSYERTEAPYGIIISSEKIFDNENSGSFNLPADSEIVETKVISYSGSKWTKDIEINENLVYNLDDYGLVYTGLGDPYAINIPNSAINPTNNIILTTAITPTNLFPGSPFNKIIYTIVKNMVSYSQIASNANGCIWVVEFEDGSPLTIKIPNNDETTDTCFYQNVGGIPTITCKDSQGVQVNCEDSDDALKIAIYNLFKKLDNDEDGRLDIKFEQQNLEITSSEITGIPYPWETEVQVRKWW